MKIKFAILLQYVLLLCTQSVSAVNIEMVTVGNPGNAPDKKYNPKEFPSGSGAVSYIYQIGRYEITAGQYTEFLNAVAKSDPNGLYNPYMADGIDINIFRSSLSSNFYYSVAPDWADRPVSWVSFWDAARFCNWLHNGQPTGPQGPGTTEDGAYHDIGDEALFGRNPGAKFFIPTDDEWYKAAYHDKSAGLAANYFAYPTGKNTLPGNDVTEATNPGNNMNVTIPSPTNAIEAIGPPYFVSNVGAFRLSKSPYGTFDQGGNVWEFTEATSRSFHSVRGSGWFSYANRSDSRLFLEIISTAEFWEFGFRIAAAAPVPEPTCITLFSIAVMMLGGSRFRLRRA